MPTVQPSITSFLLSPASFPSSAGGDRQGFWQAECDSLMGEELGVPHGQSDG